MKKNKVGIWISLALTVIALIAGIVLTVINANSPVKIGEKIEAEYSRGYIYFSGTLVNESNDEVTISYLEITVPTDGDTLNAYWEEPITLRAGGEFDLWEDGQFATDFRYRPKSVSSVTVTVNGFSYNIQGGIGIPTSALFAYIFAIIFGIATVSLFVSDKKKQKANASFEQNLPSFGANAVAFSGVYGKEGEKGKAAAKSVASVLGGFLAAFFLGFGAYKIYSSGTAVDLVVSDDGLFVINRAAANGGVTSIMKGNFPETEITVKKKQVIMKNAYSKEYFVFNTTKKGMSPAQLEEKLKALIAAVPEANAANGEAVSPFGEFENTAAKETAAAEQTEAQDTAAEPAAESAPDENKDDPFGNL